MKQTLPAKETRPRAIAHPEPDRDASGAIELKRDEPATSETPAGREMPLQKKANRTGLPDNLKAGIETLSGHSMDDVKVHYNSAKPARLNAHAYAQGTDIHLAPGQTKHLPHEAWHVVQQKQGRVKPVRQLKQTTPVNDDTRLEREADVMGSKALQMKSGPHTHRLIQKNMWSGAYTPVQRKIGFEIEVPSADIWVTRAEDLEDDGDAKHEGDAKDPGKKQPRVLSKGEVLHQGDGWKLTPDGSRAKGRAWTPEYIISAIDETMNAAQIPLKMAAVAKHAQDNLLNPKSWSKGGGFSVEPDRNYDGIMGSFHITGGVRLSQISQLIKTLHQGDKRITDVATRAENISVSGSNYKSVVALVALQISDLVTHESEDDYSAKRTVGILSRTDLGAVVKKVTKLTRRSTFIAEVLQAANVKADTKLFRHKLPGYVNTHRSIDNQQDLTAGEWLEKLLSGHDFTWSETRNDAGGDFGYDQVGPAAGIFNQRADGVVLELRSLDEQGPNIRPVEQWADVAARYTRLFSMLNRKAAANEVNQSFGTVEDYKKKK